MSGTLRSKATADPDCGVSKSQSAVRLFSSLPWLLDVTPFKILQEKLGLEGGSNLCVLLFGTALKDTFQTEDDV